MLSLKGNINPARPVAIVWGTLTGAAAAIALLADGLSGLQTAAILSAAPFVLIMIGLCFSIFTRRSGASGCRERHRGPRGQGPVLRAPPLRSKRAP
jgi:glycine betaine transporter